MREIKASLTTASVAVVALLIAMIGVQVNTATSAHASTPCPESPARLCTYMDVQAGGSMYYYTGINVCYEVGAPYDNNISSVKNTFDNRHAILYGAHGCSGTSCTIGPNRGLNLSPPGCFNDWVSSIKIV